MLNRIGGFSERDGTIDFYLRINSLLDESSIVLDLGAGRGCWVEQASPIKKKIMMIKNNVKELIATDIDPIVLTNTNCDRAVLIEDGKVPLPDSSIDLIICDYVLEHIENPISFVLEIKRLLKPGGVFCARTPHFYNYVSVISRLVPDHFRENLLSRAQPDRDARDAFPTIYKMNTLSSLSSFFVGWEDHTFVYRAEPSYFFSNRTVFRLLDFMHRLLPVYFAGSLMVFKRKPSHSSEVF
jgi:SAM-dependent methyltransferase